MPLAPARGRGEVTCLGVPGWTVGDSPRALSGVAVWLRAAHFSRALKQRAGRVVFAASLHACDCPLALGGLPWSPACGGLTVRGRDGSLANLFTATPLRWGGLQVPRRFPKNEGSFWSGRGIPVSQASSSPDFYLGPNVSSSKTPSPN